jgi:hypothetical protein
MNAIPAYIESYFAELNAQRMNAPRVQFKAVKIEDWEPLPNRCHDNVDRWVAENPTRGAVRGWLIGATGGDGSTMYIAHSVVQEGDELYDITPLNPPDLSAQFLKHKGTQAEFDVLKIAWTGRFYPFYTELSHEHSEAPDGSEEGSW